MRLRTGRFIFRPLNKGMEYPVQLSFKVLALASQIYIRDSGGTMQGYVKQKLFKLKEQVEVFTTIPVQFPSPRLERTVSSTFELLTESITRMAKNLAS